MVSMKHLDELKKLQAEGQWPPASEEEARRILGIDAAAKAKTSKKSATARQV